ncbi:hypothetical protein EJ05DRAFT_26224 [Pseudovirgaria hyperparasitica]|uniref:Uncharacterized protein n=1 Tax=Pseudovirgaria hyperparasitica TaxID=470096 RepID=A0A6A6WM75_9PEZI|nr:uncharacterized protein EJ05DRAFT_26224 [Pseudovirgaria hyperparasitica]KAF2763119.1 hypothetical protein EJ05DRAFT_26224 [Pseudovirgaria hyperparasitica]
MLRHLALCVQSDPRYRHILTMLCYLHLISSLFDRRLLESRADRRRDVQSIRTCGHIVKGTCRRCCGGSMHFSRRILLLSATDI